MMMIFMFFSWNTFLVQVAEQEQSKAEEELMKLNMSEQLTWKKDYKLRLKLRQAQLKLKLKLG